MNNMYMQYCVEMNPTFLTGTLATFSLSVLSYAIYQYWYDDESSSKKTLEESAPSLSLAPNNNENVKMQRAMSEDSVEIPPMFMHFHKLIGALSAEALPNWCLLLGITWTDVIQDILEWMEHAEHPNFYDFESCIRILTYEEEEDAPPKMPLGDEESRQALIWMNVALQVWNSEPMATMPHAWFILEELEAMQADTVTDKTETETETETEKPIVESKEHVNTEN